MSTIEPNATPASAGLLRSARQLLKRSGREKAGLFITEGVPTVREALLANRVKTLIVEDLTRYPELLELSDQVQVVTADASELAGLTDTVTNQGVVAICRTETIQLAELPDQSNLVVICSQIRDPGNAGTVIRCADAFGADAVIFTTGSVEVTNPKTVRSSVGSVFHLPIVTGVPLADALDWARAEDLQIFAADARGRRIDELAEAGGLRRPTAWVFGNEAWGFADIELGGAEIVSVPMWGRAESLNLSTAAAICLFSSASAINKTTE